MFMAKQALAVNCVREYYFENVYLIGVHVTREPLRLQIAVTVER